MKCAEFREQVVHVVLGQAEAGVVAAARALPAAASWGRWKR